MNEQSQVEIRLATREDLPAIVQMLLRDSLLDPPPQAKPTEQQIAAFELIAADPSKADPNNRIVVAALDGEIVGTLQLIFIPGLSHKGMWRAEVEAVRVREDLRNRRIGTRLMEWVVDRARERGCWVVQLSSNRVRTDAHRFYQRLGFKASHTGMKLYL